MPLTVAIAGSGPTAIYCLKHLLASRMPLSITLFERQDVAGRGMPYSEESSSAAMLSNIASIEIPPVTETLVGWLHRQTDEALTGLGITRTQIDERTFYPRLLLGEYFEAQLNLLVIAAERAGHAVRIATGHDVLDVQLAQDRVTLDVRLQGGDVIREAFDYLVLATGHVWPEHKQVNPGYFPSPWPAEDIARIRSGRVGILGTSLSALDVMSEVARSNGLFFHDEAGKLTYRPSDTNEAELRISLMSRKGVLPEADFFCPLPHEEPVLLNAAAIERLKRESAVGLLDRTFAIFLEELMAADPDYVASLGLLDPTPERFSESYFAARENAEPLSHAARNLAEAKSNYENEYTVPWRYTILRMHENFGSLAPNFDEQDAKRFNRTMKPVFQDNYATVPHQAIERLMALHNAGTLDVVGLGSDYEMDTASVERGARVVLEDRELIFDTVVDATGQQRLNREDLPFQTLREQTAKASHGQSGPEDDQLDVTEDFRIRVTEDLGDRVYCLSLPYLIGRYPFIQGITSSQELGEAVSRSILSRLEGKPEAAEQSQLIIAA